MLKFIKKNGRKIILGAVCCIYLWMIAAFKYPGIPAIGLIFTIPLFFDEGES